MRICITDDVTLIYCETRWGTGGSRWDIDIVRVSARSSPTALNRAGIDGCGIDIVGC